MSEQLTLSMPMANPYERGLPDLRASVGARVDGLRESAIMFNNHVWESVHTKRQRVLRAARYAGCVLLLCAALTACGSASTATQSGASPSTTRMSAVTTTAVICKPPSIDPNSIPGGHQEIEQYAGEEFVNPCNAGGGQQYQPAGQHFVAKCIWYNAGSAQNVSSTRGLWYLDSNGYYTPTNRAENQDHPIPPDNQNIYDPKMQHDLCPGSAPLPSYHG